MKEEDYIEAIKENLEKNTEISLRQATQNLLDLYDLLLTDTLEVIGLEDYMKKDFNKKAHFINIRLGLSKETLKTLDNIWNRIRGPVYHNRTSYPSKNQILNYFEKYEGIKAEIVERIEVLNGYIHEKVQTDDFMIYLFETKISALKTRFEQLIGLKKVRPSTYVPIKRYEKILDDLKKNQGISIQSLMAYEELLIMLLQTYEDPNVSKKLVAQYKQSIADIRNSYIQIHECANCNEGFLGIEKDNTPGFRTRDYYWCVNCTEDSKVGDLIYFDTFKPESFGAGAIPEEFRNKMQFTRNEKKFDLIWRNSIATVRLGALILVNNHEKRSEIELISLYCLLDIEVNSISELNWNEYALKHQKYLRTKKGMNHLRKKIENGDFSRCPDCRTPLLPVGQRNKPYISSLYLACFSCNKAVDRVESVDGAVYGKWWDLENPDFNWLNKLKGK
ncbi:MAG: hypothetical protein ACE5OZ_13880 [Candidatus Heimdallarchaeota archaeon]